MPLYEYRCNTCSHLFEELVSASSRNTVSCPVCRGTGVTRQMSVFAAHGGQSDPPCASGACTPGGCDVAPKFTGGGCCGGACSH